MNGNAKNWDWLKMLPMWEYHQLVLDKWPGWELDIDAPTYVTLTFTHEKGGKGSREIAIEWDDLARGQFYYRDYTKNNLPLVEYGDRYESIFIFQLLADAETFRERYCAI